MPTYTIINSVDGTFRVHRKGCADIKRREGMLMNGMADREAENVETAIAAEREGFRNGGFGDEADDFDANEGGIGGQAAEECHAELFEPAIVAAGEEGGVAGRGGVAGGFAGTGHSVQGSKFRVV